MREFWTQNPIGKEGTKTETTSRLVNAIAHRSTSGERGSHSTWEFADWEKVVDRWNARVFRLQALGKAVRSIGPRSIVPSRTETETEREEGPRDPISSSYLSF